MIFRGQTLFVQNAQTAADLPEAVRIGRNGIPAGVYF